MIKVIVAGTRTFQNYNLLERKLTKILQNQAAVEIISGGARGADTLGEKFAQQHGYKTTKFLPNWKAWGRQAGYRRNLYMAQYATHLVAFWDGKSRGIAHMIEIAKAKGLRVRIIRY